jgi:hypothetical protein
MFAIVINNPIDLLDISSNDVVFNYFPRKLVDGNGIQYPLSVLNVYDGQKILDLFGIYTVEEVKDFVTYDPELEDMIVGNIKIDGYKIIKTYILQDKSQEIIDQVNEKRAFEQSIEYRKQRKLAYIEQISPEKDPITTLGDVVDALYQVIQNGDTTKLDEISVKIESIKSQYPKPT